MLTTTLLLATLAVGIDTGYEPTADGGLEYIIQIPPNLLNNLEPGEVIKSELPEDLRGVRRYRIQVGTDRLPKIHAPASLIESSIPEKAKPLSEAVQTSAHSPIQAPSKRSPFELGPTTHTTNQNPNARYSSRTPNATGYGTNPAATAQTNFQGYAQQNPLQLPPPPDGLDHLYNTPAGPNYTGQPNPGQVNPGQVNPATGLQNVPAGYPNNQYVNAQQNPNYPYQNQFPNGQVPNYQYQNGQYPNGQMGGYPNNMQPNPNIGNNGYPNNGYQNGNNGMQNPNNFVNNTGQGNPQMPNGYQGGQNNQQGTTPGIQQTADNRNSTSFGSNSSTKEKAEKERTVTFREEVSAGDISAADRKKAAEEEPKPWLPMYVTGLAAVGSLLGNLYLAWMWLETRRRYRQAIIERTLVA